MGVDSVYLVKNNSLRRVLASSPTPQWMYYKTKFFKWKKKVSVFKIPLLSLSYCAIINYFQRYYIGFPYMYLAFPSFSFLYGAHFLVLTYHQVDSLKNNPSNVGWQKSSRNFPFSDLKHWGFCISMNLWNHCTVTISLISKSNLNCFFGIYNYITCII